MERERDSSWDSLLEFLDLTDTETDAPELVMREAEDFCRAAFLRSSLTVEEGAGLSLLGSLELSLLRSLELGDLLALRELEDLPFGGMAKRRELEGEVVLVKTTDSWIVHCSLVHSLRDAG